MVLLGIGTFILIGMVIYYQCRSYSRRMHKTIFVMIHYEGYAIQSLQWIPDGKFRSLHITFKNGRVVREVGHRGYWHDDMGPIRDEALLDICYKILCAQLECTARNLKYPQSI